MSPIDSRARSAAQITFAILLVLLALWVASDFLTALALATVIAITIWPVYARFAALFNEDRSSLLAPLLFTLLTGLVLIVPILLTVHQMVQGSDAFVHWITPAARRNSGTQLGCAASVPVRPAGQVEAKTAGKSNGIRQ